MAGLKRQHNLLEELIVQLENKTALDGDDNLLYQDRTHRIAKNLKALRKIKDQYAMYLESIAYGD